MSFRRPQLNRTEYLHADNKLNIIEGRKLSTPQIQHAENNGNL